jgi:hypothetical protein
MRKNSFMPNINKTIALIPQMDDARLMALYKNCIRDQASDELGRMRSSIIGADRSLPHAMPPLCA